MAAGDARTVAALVPGELAGTIYAPIATYFLQLAGSGETGEARGLTARRGAEIVGVVLYGDVAGAMRTARIQFVAVAPSARRTGVGRRLCEAAIAEVEGRGARLTVAEMPDEARFDACRSLFHRCGLAEAGRVPDFHADGVALLILARPYALSSGR